MKFDKAPEGIQEIDKALALADTTPYLFSDPGFRRLVKSMCRVLSNTAYKPVVIDNVVYDPRLVPEIPVEERKRQEFKKKGKAYRVPEWWQGERANYNVAKQMMVSLPKKKGSPVV